MLRLIDSSRRPEFASASAFSVLNLVQEGEMFRHWSRQKTHYKQERGRNIRLKEGGVNEGERDY